MGPWKTEYTLAILLAKYILADSHTRPNHSNSDIRSHMACHTRQGLEITKPPLRLEK